MQIYCAIFIWQLLVNVQVKVSFKTYDSLVKYDVFLDETTQKNIS